jgi:hypothetical protein
MLLPLPSPAQEAVASSALERAKLADFAVAYLELMGRPASAREICDAATVVHQVGFPRRSALQAIESCAHPRLEKICTDGTWSIDPSRTIFARNE